MLYYKKQIKSIDASIPAKWGFPSLCSPYGDGGGIADIGTKSPRAERNSHLLICEYTSNVVIHFSAHKNIRERSNDCAKLSEAKFSFGAKTLASRGFLVHPTGVEPAW